MNTSDKHTDATGSQPPIKRIGVVGLGHMGGNFAHNLVADGYRVTVYDRNETQTVPFVALGATAASSMDDLANCEAVLTSLPDDKALIEVTLSKRRLLHVLAPGAIHLSMSTVSPDLSRGLDREHRAAGQGFVSAPVLGNPTSRMSGSSLYSLPELR
jgi:3-hydroxyisobutyrate dehydrogenase-like beta-hydroxyacid dehydrogenase